MHSGCSNDDFCQVTIVCVCECRQHFHVKMVMVIIRMGQMLHRVAPKIECHHILTISTAIISCKWQ